jgi:hypothetical protein
MNATRYCPCGVCSYQNAVFAHLHSAPTSWCQLCTTLGELTSFVHWEAKA